MKDGVVGKNSVCGPVDDVQHETSMNDTIHEKWGLHDCQRLTAASLKRWHHAFEDSNTPLVLVEDVFRSTAREWHELPIIPLHPSRIQPLSEAYSSTPLCASTNAGTTDQEPSPLP